MYWEISWNIQRNLPSFYQLFFQQYVPSPMSCQCRFSRWPFVNHRKVNNCPWRRWTQMIHTLYRRKQRNIHWKCNMSIVAVKNFCEKKMFKKKSFFLNLRVFDHWYGNRPSFIAQGTRIACMQHSAKLPRAFVYVCQLPHRLVRYGRWNNAKTSLRFTLFG